MLLMVSGCRLIGPTYKKPEVELPFHFKHAEKIDDAVNLHRWWDIFEDPILSDLIQKALARNYNLHKAMEHIEEYRALYQIQQAQFFPEVNGAGTLNRVRYSDSLLFFDLLNQLTYNYGQLGFVASWEIDMWGRLRRLKKAAHAEFRAHVEAMRDLCIMIIADVAYAYIEIRTLEEKIAIQKNIVDCDNQLLTLYTSLLVSGLDNGINPNLQQEQLAEDKANLVQYTIAKAEQQHALAVLLGENPESFSLPSCTTSVVPYVTVHFNTGLPSELLRRRPDIRKAEAMIEATNEYIGAAMADYFPRFSLMGNTGLETNFLANFFDGSSLSWSIGPSIDWRFLTFGRIKYNVEAKKSIHYQAVSAYAQTILDALKEVENSLVAYFQNQQKVALLSTKYDASINVIDLRKSQYNAGLSPVLPVVQCQRDAFFITQQIIDAKMVTSAALVLLFKALGGGWKHATDCD